MARKAAEPRPWQRVERGRHRSSDERFTIDQGDPGRWFLIDDGERDELGMARTLGPFQTLDDAKAKADELRAAPAAESPLAERLADAAKRPKPKAPEKPRSKRAPESDDRPKLVSLPPPETWIDKLPDGEATRARRSIAALERLGLDDAERLVRRDLETGEPAVAEFVLRRFVESQAIEPLLTTDGLAQLTHDRPELRAAFEEAREAGLTEDETRALAYQVALAVVDATLDAVSRSDRPPGTDDTLPGWQLVERDAHDPPRRMRF